MSSRPAALRFPYGLPSEAVATAVITPNADTQIQVEFYGLARQRTGTAMIRISTAHDLALQSLWEQLVERFPGLESADLGSSWLAPMYRVNLDGQRFVTDPRTRIQGGQCVLIMSADAGG